jgi:thiamine kinase-like enzyme
MLISSESILESVANAIDQSIEECSLIRLSGGRNNRVYKLVSENKRYLLKSYFKAPDDPRDRQGNEFNFLEYCRTINCSQVPMPIHCNRDEHWALYEFIDGEPPLKNAQTDEQVLQAIKFILYCNQPEHRKFADHLANASEACFSLTDHLDMVENRIRRLSLIEADSALNTEVVQWINITISSQWNSLTKILKKQIDKNPRINTALTQEEKILSPSDFGFHNALLKEDTSLTFVDFEFSGWDDPAKLIIDFGNQPDNLLDYEQSKLLKNALIERDVSPDKLRLRVQLLTPVYQIKWACICLNDFLPFGAARRKFHKDEKTEEIKQTQFSKAKTMLNRAEQAISTFL